MCICLLRGGYVIGTIEANVCNREKQLAHLSQISKYVLSVSSVLTAQAPLTRQLLAGFGNVQKLV